MMSEFVSAVPFDPQVKTDEHMAKVKAQLMFEQRAIEQSEERCGTAGPRVLCAQTIWDQESQTNQKHGAIKQLAARCGAVSSHAVSMLLLPPLQTHVP